MTDFSPIDMKPNQRYEHLIRVWSVMRDGGRHTLAEISKVTKDPEASVSARLRDLRKPQFGGHTVERRQMINGKFLYRVDP